MHPLRHLQLLLSLLLATGLVGTELPPDERYVVVDADGHLSVDGERERYWAVIGKPYIPARVAAEDDAETRAEKLHRSRAGTDALLDRYEQLGFNAVRLWDVTTDEDYEPGDGSHADCVDYFVAEAGKRGMRIWTAGLGNRVGDVAPEDVDVLDDPATREAWMEAAAIYQGQSGAGTNKQTRKTSLRHSLARHWDARLEALYIARMRANAQHLNRHNGLRWADDPTFAVWELTNEEWWMRKMVAGNWRKEPAFFRNQLVARWQEYLRAKYGDDEGLTAAWSGLLPGESLEQGSIALLPMAGPSDPAVSINDSNPHARAAFEGSEEKYGRDDFDPARGADVIAFFLEIQLAHKQRCRDAVKTFGKSCRLSPTIFDTGIGYEIQSQYIHQHADAVAHDAYINGWGPQFEQPDHSDAKSENREMVAQLGEERIAANDGMWVNWLKKPPGIAQGVPWLEHNRVAGKPYLVYETQIQQPARYRADYPLRLAALASIQDWDWISWHYFAPPGDVGVAERPFDRKLDVSTGGHPQGYHFTYDEVQNAMMRQAALIWRQQLLAPAPNPTTFIWGRKSLTDPASMDYAGSYGTSGMDMLQTVYQYGVRIQIDPTREDDEVIGPVVSYAERHSHNPYTPTDAITFDWQQGYLMFDDPQAVAFTGMLADYGDEVRFASGVVLRDVSIANPEGMWEPIREDETYLAFALTSEDGKPLAESGRLSLALQSTSFNTGFRVEDPLGVGANTNGLKGHIHAGDAPVLVARVGATVHAPFLDGMRYTFRDWHWQEIGGGTVTGGELAVPADLPVFVVELQRE